MSSRGIVYLVGAGPGDPGLITAKGLRLLQTAEVLVYDRLVELSLVAEVPDSAEFVYPREEPRGRPGDQEEINSLLIDHARRGRMVVRLKGGDPFLFGRGGEEADALAAAGIPFEVVPGVTSALAVPAYAGIPVTDRRYASSLRVLTGSAGNPGGRPTSGMPDETVVALMAVRRLPEIVDRLRREGWPDDAPVALIERGTTSRQRTIETTLGRAVDVASERELSPPAIGVFGGVVSARSRIAWYERKRLFGVRVLVTRPRSQSSTLRDLLENEGAEAVLAPSIAFADPVDWSAVDHAIDQLGRFRWIAFTSQNGVAFFLRRLWERGKDNRELSQAQIAAVGPSTAATLETRGIRADLVTDSTAHDLGAHLASQLNPGDIVLHPRGDRSDDGLADGIGSDARTDPVTTYRTVPPSTLSRIIEDGFRSGIDAGFFASPSAVANIIEAANGHLEQLSRATIVSIGPVTSAAIREAGLNVAAEAEKPTDRGMVDALLSTLAR